jgi:chromosome segregation ATPase
LELKQEEIRQAETDLSKHGQGFDCKKQLQHSQLQCQLKVKDTERSIAVMQQEKHRLESRVAETRSIIIKIQEDLDTCGRKETDSRNMIAAKEQELTGLQCQQKAIELKQAQIKTIEQAKGASQQDHRAKPMCDFQYQLPYASFDKQSVYGLIGRLFSVKSPEENGIAITQLLGGRVFNTVVVRNQEVAVALMKGGGL